MTPLHQPFILPHQPPPPPTDLLPKLLEFKLTLADVHFGLLQATDNACPTLRALAGTKQLFFFLSQSSRVSGHMPSPAHKPTFAKNNPRATSEESQVKVGAPKLPDTAYPCLKNSGSHLNLCKITFLVLIITFPFLKSSTSEISGNNPRLMTICYSRSICSTVKRTGSPQNPNTGNPRQLPPAQLKSLYRLQRHVTSNS